MRTDVLIMPYPSDERPDPVPDAHVGLAFDTNGQAMVYFRNPIAGTNEWRTLELSPALPTQTWVRVTLLQDYAHRMFQVRLDGIAIEDDEDWSGPGGTRPGSWFYMPATNGALRDLAFAGDGEA